MTMDKSLRIRAGLARARSVLTRGERITRLQSGERWEEGQSPMGLPKVRVYKLSLRKKKKRKEDEGEAGAAAPGEAAAKPAAGAAAKPAAKPGAKPAGKGGGKSAGGK